MGDRTDNKYNSFKPDKIHHSHLLTSYVACYTFAGGRQKCTIDRCKRTLEPAILILEMPSPSLPKTLPNHVQAKKDSRQNLH